MYTAPLPENEEERLAALCRYDILDSEPEQKFDDITRLSAYICDAPFATVTMVDRNRQWFKSAVGLTADKREDSRDVSFCATAILHPTVTIIPDATKDPRFRDNPLVTGEPRIRFYAGAPVVTPEGYALGTLCVFDNKPRSLTLQQIEALQILARQVMTNIELRALNGTMRSQGRAPVIPAKM